MASFFMVFHFRLIIHGKFMVLNQGHEIDNCNILDHEKRFMGFS